MIPHACACRCKHAHNQTDSSISFKQLKTLNLPTVHYDKNCSSNCLLESREYREDNVYSTYQGLWVSDILVTIPILTLLCQDRTNLESLDKESKCPQKTKLLKYIENNSLFWSLWFWFLVFVFSSIFGLVWFGLVCFVLFWFVICYDLWYK